MSIHGLQRLTPLVDSRVDSDAMQSSAYPMSMARYPAQPERSSSVTSSKTVLAAPSTGFKSDVVEKSSITSQESAVDKKIEAEIEAERLWWSEVSERQVKELESTFGMEFQKTTDKLRVDISRCQDRLEMLVEQEKSQRQATTEALRRDVDTSQAAATELSREVSDLRKAVEVSLASRSAPSADPQTLQLVTRLQSDLDASRTQMGACISSHASLRTEWENHKMQTAPTEVAVSDLRRDMNASQEHQELHLTQIKDLRRDLTALAEKVQLQAHSNDEVHALHQVIMRSANDLGCGIEEVSSAVLATEQKLRQELEAARCTLEASLAKQRVETLEALDLSSKQLAQSLADEVEKRGLEANILSARIDAMTGQLDDLQATSKRTAAALQSVQFSPLKESRSTSESATTSEVSVLRNSLDAVKSDLSRLEVVAADDRATSLSAAHESRRHAEESAAATGERVGRLEVLAAEERSARLSDMAEIRRYTEDVISKRLSQAAVEAGAGAQGIAGDQGTLELSSMASASIAAEVQAFRVDMASVKANLQVLDAECRRTASVAARTEAELQSLEAESRKSASLPPRIEGLAGRLDGIESELRQAVTNLPDLRSFEGEVRRCMSEFGVVAGRVDAVEAEARRAAREASPLVARLDAVESEIQRVIRDSAPLAAKFDALRSDVKDLSMRQSAATAVATTVGSQTPTALSTAGSVTSAPSANTSMVSRLAQAPSLLAAAGATPADRGSPLRGRSVTRQPAAEVASGPPSRGVPVPALSSELKNTIETLVHKVNATIKKSEGPPAVEQMAANPSPAIEVPVTAAQGQASLTGLSSSMRERLDNLNQSVTQQSSALATQDGFLQALQAVQELRERNLCLREENAELVEELLNQDGLMTPSQAYLASASQSTCATPSQQQQPTAQLPAGIVRARSPDPATQVRTAAVTQAQRADATPAGSITKPMPSQQVSNPGSSALSVASPQPYQGPITRIQGGGVQANVGRTSVGTTPTTATPGTASATAGLRYGRGPAPSTGQPVSKPVSAQSPGARKKFMV
mmetsp:Transcript_49564/g.92860  ORF Transcript_49564/g.92860 Transcript_49564/m.92860 type:complete len:1042 (-) Transcript_49564:69-3194(-)